MKSQVKTIAIAGGVTVLSFLFLANRAKAAVGNATDGAFDFTSEDNIINNSVEHVTGFSLTRYGESLGGWLYKIRNGQ